MLMFKIVADEKADELRKKEVIRIAKLNQDEFLTDVLLVWKQYRVEKYGAFSFLFRYVYLNSVLFELFYETKILNYDGYWFNKKWRIVADSGHFHITNIETGKKFSRRY